MLGAKPLTIWRIGDDTTSCGGDSEPIVRLVQDESTAASLLQKKQYNGRKVVIICVAGPARLGKSFLLNCFLRHFRHGNSPLSDVPAHGFSWGKSAHPITKGIQLWSEPLSVCTSDGQQLVVLLMDTEGVFDMQTSFAHCAKLSAFSAYLSSMLIFNLGNRFRQNDLDFLRYCSNHGSRVSELDLCGSFLCPQLTFLVRDWVNQENYNYGWEDGHSYMNDELTTSFGVDSVIMKDLKRNFPTVNCFLMPRPEGRVTDDLQFTGQWSEMPANFAKYLRAFIETFLHVDCLHVKCVSGRAVLWEDLPDLFRSVTKAFNQSDLPDLESLVPLSTKLTARVVIETCTQLYVDHMKQVDFSGRDNLQLSHFGEEHAKAFEVALQHLHSKLPGQNVQQWERLLESEIEKSREPFWQHFLSILGHSVVKSCTELYSTHMNQVDFFSLENPCIEHFEAEHEQASKKAIEHLRDRMPEEDLVRWRLLLDKNIHASRLPCLEIFLTHLGYFVLNVATGIYSAHMDQVDYSMCKDLTLAHFDGEHENALEKALQSLHTIIPMDEEEKWSRALKDNIHNVHKTPFLEKFITFFGNSVVTTCTELYSNHMNQLDVSAIDDPQTHLFDEAHAEASSKARQLFHDKMFHANIDSHLQALEEAIERCQKLYWQTFQLHLQKAHEHFNKQLLDDCVNQFIINLPSRIYPFDLKSLVKRKFEASLRGDEVMKKTFQDKLLDKLKAVERYNVENSRSNYQRFYNFIELWQNKSTKEQQLLAMVLPKDTCNRINMTSHAHLLRAVVSFILLGRTKDEVYEQYKDNIDRFMRNLERYSRQEENGCVLKFDLIFIHYAYESDLRTGISPVFRIVTGDDSCGENSTFIDRLGTPYENWQAFLKSNIDRHAYLLVPSYGEYTRDHNGQIRVKLIQPQRNESQSVPSAVQVPNKILDTWTRLHSNQTISLLLRLTYYWIYGEFPHIEDLYAYLDET